MWDFILFLNTGIILLIVEDTKLYKVITPFSDDEIKTKCNPIVKMILSRFSTVGYEFDPKELIKSNKESIEYTCTLDSFRRYHSIALEIGVSSGILKKRDNFVEKEKNMALLKSVEYWQSLLRSSKYKNLNNSTTNRNNTPGVYISIFSPNSMIG
jgi:hypothetical protein